MVTLRDLIAFLGPRLDPYLTFLAGQLFSPMEHANKTIQVECEATLAIMVKCCSSHELIETLVSVAEHDKNAMIRVVACRTVNRFVSIIGHSRALKDYGRLIIPLYCLNAFEKVGL